MEFDLNSLDSSSIEMLGEATEGVENLLTAFASNEAFSTSITLTFGNPINVEAVENFRQQWTSGNFQGLPRIEIRSATEINSANGAFASATNTIYLSREFLTQNATNPRAVTDVLLEEVGHYIDSKLNASDTAGDEGAIFSSLVQGETLNERQLQSIRAEDDSATVTLDGQTFSIEQASGQPYYVNALLYPGEPRWSPGSPVGAPVTVTYSFLSQVPDYYANNAKERTGFQTIDQYQPNGTIRTAIGRALDYWSSFANISFTPVTGLGEITFGAASTVNESAHAYSPGSGIGGDVWLNTNENSNLTQTPGSFGFATLLHEIGHALGLKHPGNYNAGGGSSPLPYLSVAEDNNTNTIMTYNDVSSAASPMLYDIAALQYLYGASFYNTTSTTYSFSSVYSYRVNGGSQNFGSTTTTPTKLTIWDSYGTTDTLDFSALLPNALGYRFDLNQGGINTTQSAYNGSLYPDYNAPSGPTYPTSTFGTVIAFNTLIEDAIGSSSNDIIYGNTTSNLLRGEGGNDTIYGGSGNDNLQGGDGNNYLYGEFGNDFFIGGNQAFQTDYIDGGQDNDAIYAVGGDDVLIGNSGLDSLHGGEGNDFIFGGTENDYLFGGSQSVTLTNTGNDDLNGGAGDDVMNGQDGNDSYTIDSTGDVIIEDSSTGGIDTVYSTISWTLGTNLENLTLQGTNPNSGTGNALNNTIIGNATGNLLDGSAGRDTMRGQDGDDTYIVDIAGDIVIEDSSTGGIDDVVWSYSSYTLSANIERLTLFSGAITGTGNDLNNLIYAYEDNNTLKGLAGNDTLEGGEGNDLVDGGGDNDVLWGGSFTYPTSNTGDDKLTGDRGDDTLNSQDGNDTLVGGLGNDVLTGGVGGVNSDKFLFDTNAAFNKSTIGIDTITDFTRGADKIVLDKTTFTALSNFSFSSVGTLARAQTSSARITYIQSSGSLFYNQNGSNSGFGKGDQFADLTDGLALAASDFLVQA